MWFDRGSNQGHLDLQSDSLPTALSDPARTHKLSLSNDKRFCFIFPHSRSVVHFFVLFQFCHMTTTVNYIVSLYRHLSRDMTKSTKWHECPAKTQISLGICPVWSESLLSTWRKLGSLVTHWAHSEDWSDWVDAQADLSLRWAYTHFVSFVMRWLNWYQHQITRWA